MYLIAAAVLLLIFTPEISAAALASREGADWRYADGVRAVLDSLNPGVKITFSYASSPSADELVLAGDSVSVNDGQGVLTFRTAYPVPGMTLMPTLSYVAQLIGGRVEVTEVV